MAEDFSPVSWEGSFLDKSPLGPEGVSQNEEHRNEASSEVPSSKVHSNEPSNSSQASLKRNDNLLDPQDSISLQSDAPIAIPGEPSTTYISKENIFINSTVSEPQKEQEGSQNAYISYLITTESNSPTFQTSLFHVRRRFSDFYFLFSMLYLEYPAAAVPPLPDKSRLEYIKGDRFGPEFTLKRAASLNRFLDRISHHPILKRSTVYLRFLETSEWNAYKRSLASRHQQVLQENSVLDGLSDSLLNAFAKVNKPDDELMEVKERVVKLEDNLLQVEKSFSKVLRRQSDLAYDLEDFSQQLIKLAGLENNLESDIISFANGTHNLSRGVATLREQTDSDYVVSLRDLQNYVVSLKALIKLREQKQLDLEALTDYLNKGIYEKENLMAGGGSNFIRSKIEDVRGVNQETSRKERIYKLDLKIESLTKEVESVKQSSETFQELAINEVAIFENNKQLEMKKTLSTLADNYIKFHQNIIDQWETTL